MQHFSTYYWQKLQTSGPAQFRSVLFNSQLQMVSYIHMHVCMDRLKVIIICHSQSYYNMFSWLGEKNSGVIAITLGILVEMCCTIECHLCNVSHMKKMLRSLPNGKNGWINRWSQYRLSGKCCDGRSVCTRSWDSQDNSNPQESFLKGENTWMVS